MTTTVVRPVGYTGSLQQLEWNYGNGVQVTAYLWGGGGGGGGNDSNRGGYGSGGGYSVSSFTVNNGDTIKVAVGGKGNPGGSNAGGAAGGAAGASWIPTTIFDTRINSPINYTDPQGNYYPATPTYPYTNRAWCGFLNAHGVWYSNQGAYSFQNWYTVNVPTDGNYLFTFSTDNYGSYYIANVVEQFWQSYQSTSQRTVFMAAGTYYVFITGVNAGGPGGIGLTIADAASGYSGGSGGRAGYGGSSGGGGGGGGATVVLLNDAVVSVAGGGGGGGGGGNAGAAVGQNAPGTRGQSAETPGQNGEDKSGDGGGGGGGGGGYGGGNGGAVPGGDQGGYAGSYGTGDGDTTENPNSRTPAGTSSPYFSGGIGQGGLNTQPGTAGYAVFVFDLPGVYVNQGGTYTPVSKVWVKDNGIWKQPRSIYVKNGGVWREVIGGMPPTFTAIDGNFGVNSRLFG